MTRRRATCGRWALVVVTVSASALVSPEPGGAQARQGLLSLEDARLFYEVLGSGPPIVVVHGGPGLDHNYLRPGLDVLASRYTLVYYDQRGTGRSSARLDSASINLDAFVRDIDALRMALGYERIAVLGHSFGALIALEYARRYPDHTAAVVLMNPVEPGTRFREATARRLASRRSPADRARLDSLMASEAVAARDPATLSEVYRLSFRAAMKDTSRIGEVDLELRRATARQGQTVAELLGGSVAQVDWSARLPEVAAPALVLHGRYDVAPLEMSRALADALPRGRLEVLDAGHFPFVEDPEGLTRAVASFLTGVEW